ncbi:MAG TPA: signal peptidase II [Galbitalea sp.]
MSTVPTPETPETDPQRDAAAGSSVGHRLFWVTITVGAIVVLIDQLTKWWALVHLKDGNSINVIGDLITFRLVFNPGAAFSTGTSITWVFTIVSGAAAIVIAYFAWRATSRRWSVGLGLVFGGATTHFGDRLFRAPGFGHGYVVDFIDYKYLFIGNVADIAIVGGVVFVVILMIAGVRMRGTEGGAAEDLSSSHK